MVITKKYVFKDYKLITINYKIDLNNNEKSHMWKFTIFFFICLKKTIEWRIKFTYDVILEVLFEKSF